MNNNKDQLPPKKISWRSAFNFITGCIGFVVWIYLTKNATENAINIALGVLLMLIGFGGRDTIIDIVKSFREP